MNDVTSLDWPDAPSVRRVRYELRQRTLDVKKVERLTPHMIRVTLGGPELEGFTSEGPDDHIKLFLPNADASIDRRDYTPRRYDATRGELLIDFVDHDGGPATEWARNAKIGDRLVIGGPRGSRVIGSEVRNWLLVGDETALPAIGRLIEELPTGTQATALICVPGLADRQTIETSANVDIHWIVRPQEQAGEAASLVEALRKVEIKPSTFAWIAAEAKVARAVRNALVDELGHPQSWLKASGYWVLGQADASEKNIGEAD